jgi:hypothetical protein
MVLAAQGGQQNSTALTVIQTAMDLTGRTEAIEQGVNSFVEGSALLMKVLDDVAKLHPFVGGKLVTLYPSPPVLMLFFVFSGSLGIQG